MRKITRLIKTDERPKGGPKTKMAFIQENHDAYGVWGTSSVWSQFEKSEWAFSNAEYSWRIFNEIGTKRSWNDIANYGAEDISALPAYGMYDIIPATASAEKMSQYDYLIFVGWNTMSEEIYSNLEKYVEKGGKHFISAAHLNTNSKRNSTFEPIKSGDLSMLLGCTLSNKIISTNNGVKFEKDSILSEILYPGTTDKINLSFEHGLRSSLFCDYKNRR